MQTKIWTACFAKALKKTHRKKQAKNNEMQSLIQASILIAVAALTMQLAAAQPNKPTIEVQFRIVEDYIVDNLKNSTKIGAAMHGG